MKTVYTPFSLILFLLISACSGLKSQDLYINAQEERIQACTDRTMYISGEKICFSIIIFNTKDQTNEEFSRIFYCELITPDGSKVAGGKYLLQNASGKGCLTIPEETISGIYFLKFYTRFMRNVSTDEYKFIMLKIINPYKTEVLSVNNAIDTINQAKNKTEQLAVGLSLNF